MPARRATLQEARRGDAAAVFGTDTPASPSARYVYLLTRLRERQITMEEATELFGVMQGRIRSAGASAPPPPPSPTDAPTAPVPPAPGGPGGLRFDDDA